VWNHADYLARRAFWHAGTYWLPDYDGSYWSYDGYVFDDYGYYGFWGCVGYSTYDTSKVGATAYDQEQQAAYDQAMYNCSYYFGDCTVSCQFWNYQ
jgi:hypothetical protein